MTGARSEALGFTMSEFNLIAYLLTDGGIGSRGEIYVASNSPAIINDFKKQTIETFGKQHFRFTKVDKATMIKFNNNEVRKQLLTRSPTYRTRPCNIHPVCPNWSKRYKSRACICNPIVKMPPTIVPKEILLASKDVKREFLMRVFTADGGPCLSFRKRGNRIETRRMVVLRCNHPTLLKSYSNMLLEFDIPHRIDNTQIQIERKESIRKFKEEINFLPNVNVERSKFWHGIEKRKMLDFLLDPSLLRPKVRP